MAIRISKHVSDNGFVMPVSTSGLNSNSLAQFGPAQLSTIAELDRYLRTETSNFVQHLYMTTEAQFSEYIKEQLVDYMRIVEDRSRANDYQQLQSRLDQVIMPQESVHKKSKLK